MVSLTFLNKTHPVSHSKAQERTEDQFADVDVNVDLREVYFLILHFLSTGPCKKTLRQFWDELQEHDLLPRRYHAWYSRSGECSGHGKDDGVSFPLNYGDLVNRYLHIKHDHLVKLLTQVMLTAAPPLRCMVGKATPSATDVPTLLGTGAFALLRRDRNNINRPAKHLPSYLRWPHLQADHIRGLHLREIGGGFPKHHRAPSIRFACYAVAKPSTMVQKMQYVKRLRGHRAAVYCAIFDRSGRYVITGSDDRLVKIWSMETAFCLCSCRGHEGDITDLAVSSNNLMVASASNDYSIRVWRLPDGIPVSVLLGHSGAVTAIAFSPRANFSSHLLSSSDDGTCRLWDARSSQCRPRIYLPKPRNTVIGNNSGFLTSNVPTSSTAPPCQILCCAYNASGTVFVTGSSDTFARVWSACRPNTEDPEQPMHEIDLLAGHENDVNYVQFSGCAVVASRNPASDFTTEENIPKFKNSWFSRDNIVTCSRDGSAIIWTPKSSRYQGKGGRWVRAYHLKVPPPPMPPQPPRGGPRQRLLPTPRGVNMIVWSLDNRFVLAAIMDCRICVWNASDGGLVHCLTGHTASTYVLDVHPFNPRIAMSAGYDGKTILWDIWEGSPIWTYDIGRYKLVDGKFSQDGTSIVLSDDVGQIYLLNTGQGESQKDAKYDQFFLGDYRPLSRDTHGNAVDQETQLAPHVRNCQDLLCDSSMIPYPEPYQIMYQRRRLGARGLEWRPSSLNFAVGTDGLSQEYQMFPLVDLDMVIERAPDFLDALYLMEPENDAIRDETDSEYFLTDESLGEDEQECAIHGSSSDSENYGSGKSLRGQKDNLRRSKRKKSLAEVEMSTSGRRGKKRIPHEQESTPIRNKKNKKSRQKSSSKRKSDKPMSLRTQRLSLRSAIDDFSDDALELSSYEEELEGSEFESSDSESPSSGSVIKKKKSVDSLHNQVLADKLSSPNDPEKSTIKCPEPIEPQVNGEKRKKLVLKLSMRKSTDTLNSESARIQQITSGDSGPSSSAIVESKPLKISIHNNERIDSLVRPCTNQAQSGDVRPVDSSNVGESSPGHPLSRNGKEPAEFEDTYSKFSVPLGHGSHGVVEAIKTELQDVHEETNNSSSVRSVEKSPLKFSLSLKDHKQAGNESGLSNQDSKEGLRLSTSNSNSHESNDVRKPKQIILKIKRNLISQNPNVQEGPSCHGANVQEGPSCHGGDSFGQYIVPRVPEIGDGSRSNASVSTSSTGNYSNREAFAEFPHTATDAVRRKRSVRLKPTSTETNSVNRTFTSSDQFFPHRSSRSSENPMETALDRFPKNKLETSKQTVKFKYSKENDESRHREDNGAVTERSLQCPERKQNWLLLLNQEEGYRYIPQLGDEIVYLAQGHQEYIESSKSLDNSPFETFRGRIRAVEICTVEDLQYSFLPSGESCCKITIKFTDAASKLCGAEFKFTLPELVDFPDFIVGKTRYDVAINRNWIIGNKCSVWWKEDNADGGTWYGGHIVSVKAKSPDFPDSPWDRYGFIYETDPHTTQSHSPWELHDPDSSFEHPQIDAQTRNRLLSTLTRLMHSARRDEDKFGILKLEEVSQKEKFRNRYPVPLSLGIVKARLENNYYRSLKSMEHDITVMLEIARHFVKIKGHLVKMKRLGGFLNGMLSEYRS